MNPFRNMKISFGNYILAKKQKKLKRRKTVYNLSTAQNIGVLFNVENMQDYEKIDPFLSFLSEHGNNIFALAYYPHKGIPSNLRSISAINIFSKEDLNWYQKPSGKFIDKFITKEFDILIDLSSESFFPVKYINNLSKACFKVGKTNEVGFEYDLTLRLNEKHGDNFYLEQLKHYLSNINNQKGA